jgi:tetratricopeptide (TPR) repeat protein
MIGYAHGLLSYLCATFGRYAQGERHGLTATELLAEVDDLPEAMGIACLNLGANLLQVGRWREALACAERSEAIGKTEDSPRLQAMAASSAGYVFAYTKQWPLALAACQRAVAACHEPFALAQSLYILGWAQTGAGQTSDAIALLEQVVAQLEQHGMHAWSAHALNRLAEAQLLAGDVAAAKHNGTRALELAHATQHALGVAEARRLLGRCECALGQLDAAGGHLAEALRIGEALGAPIDVADTLLALAEIDRAQIGAGVARDRLLQARAIFSTYDVDRAVAFVDGLGGA